MKINKMIAVAVLVVAMTGQSHAQIISGVGALIKKGKDNKAAKNYVPVFEIEGKKPSNPSKLSMQDKYVGKIVFSNQRLKLDNTSEDLFKSSFNLGDQIYARVFTSNSVENYMLYDSQLGQTINGANENIRTSYTIYYYLDGEKIMGWEQNNRAQDLYGSTT